MKGVRTARVIREERRAAVSDRLADLLREHDVSQAHVAAEAGVGETTVAEWCNRDKPRSISIADALALPERVRVELASLLLGDRFLVVERPAADRGAGDFAMAAEMMGEAAKLAQHCAASFADGRVDRAEGAQGRPLAMRVARLALGAAQVFEAAVREGVIGLVRPSYEDAAE